MRRMRSGPKEYRMGCWQAKWRADNVVLASLGTWGCGAYVGCTACALGRARARACLLRSRACMVSGKRGLATKRYKLGRIETSGQLARVNYGS